MSKTLSSSILSVDKNSSTFRIQKEDKNNMNICPKCKTICDEADEICPNCGEDFSDYDEEELESGFEPEILYMADNLAEAQAIVEFLRENDIAATYIDQSSPTRFMTAMRPSSAYSVPILVSDESIEEAQEMLEEYMAAVPDLASEFQDDEEDDFDDEDFDDEDDEEEEEYKGSQIC